MDELLLESSTVDGYLLEDGSGVILLETTTVVDDGFPYVGGGYYP